MLGVGTPLAGAALSPGGEVGESLAISDVTVTEGNAGTTEASFTVTLAPASLAPITVDYATANDTAFAPGDYAAVGTTSLLFLPGETTKTVTVSVNGDTLDEASETFFVNLTNALGGATIDDSQGVGTITDDDPSPALSVDDVTVTEGDAGTVNATFTVGLSSPSGRTVSVDYSSADGSATAPADYAASSSTLTFAAGQTTRTVTVAVNGDVLDEVNETFSVNLSNASNATIADAQGTGTITDDDPLPALTINDVSRDEGNSGTVAATFTVTLAPASGRTVTVDYATQNGTATAGIDYQATSGTLSFAAGETTKTVTVLVNGDLADEADETLFLNLTNPVSATIADTQGSGTIIDDDGQPTLSIDDTSVAEGNSGTVNATFTVTLSQASGQIVTVDHSTLDGSATAPADYTAISGASLVFNPGQTIKTISVQVNGDLLDEIDESFTVMLANPANATIGDGNGLGTITDDDAEPALAINDVSASEGDSGTTSATFTVSLGAPSGKLVTVDYATANGTAIAPGDYATAGGTLSFAAGQTSKTVAVAVNGDTLDEPNETFTVNLSNAVNAAIGDPVGTGTITDDDATPTLAISDATVLEGDAPTTVQATFTVSLSAASGQTVSVQAVSANDTASTPADYAALAPTTLSFNPGETTKQVSITVNGDALDEDNEIFHVTLATPTNATIVDSQGVGTITDDDPLPALSINDVTLSEGNTGTVAATFAVTLAPIGGRTVTVEYSTQNGTATAGADYQSNSGTLTFTAGQTTKTVTVLVNGDVLDEIDESFTVRLANALNATIADDLGLGTITDDDSAPALSINDVSTTEGDAGTTSATFAVSLDAPSGRLITVDYASANGTAIAPADYAAAGATVSFAAGETSKTVTVDVNGDLLDEANETFAVNLSNPSNATIADPAGIGTITDNDPLPELTVGDATVTEGDAGTTTATFTVTLSPVSGREVTLNYATANGSATAPADYTATSGSLSFAAGETTKTVTVSVNGDVLDEDNESFTLNLSNAPNATILDSQGVGTITDDDPLPAVSINDVSLSEGDSGSANASFTVTLAQPSGRPVTVDWATANGSATAPADYIAAGGTVTFLPGQTSRTVLVAVRGDELDEPDETYAVNLTNPSNAILVDDRGVGTIIDDDGTPSLSINDVTVTEGQSGTVNANFTVTLSAASGRVVTVDYGTEDGTASAGTDYVAGSGSLVFNPGQTTRPITIQVTSDLLDEPDETFRVNLSSPLNATIANGLGIGTIRDDDAPPTISVSDVAVAEGDAGTVGAAYTVNLSAPSSRPISVDYATADGTAIAPPDYAAATGTLGFAAGQTTKTVTVDVNGDTLDEANETFNLNLSNATNATLGDPAGVGTINDNDPLPAMSVSDATVTEGDSGTVNATFTVTVAPVSGREVSVDYATANETALAGSDYQATSGRLTLAAGEATKTITVPVIGDTLDEAAETFRLNLTNVSAASIVDGQGTATITDNDPPVAMTVDDVTVLEGNSGTVPATFTVSLGQASGQTVSVDYATANGTAAAPGDYATAVGALSFAPGETTKTVTVNVNGDMTNEANETYTLNLSNAVNAAVADGEGLGTITNDDGDPALSVNDVSVTEGDSGTVNANFTVTLAPASGQVVSVTYATADGTANVLSDYLAATGPLTFTPGQTTKTVTVPIVGDTLDEANENFTLGLSLPVNATIADNLGLGTITDNDPLPQLAITDVTVAEGNFGTVEATFTVSLNAPSGRLVSVDYATGDGTATAPADYAATTGPLSFAPGETTKTVTVLVNGDTLDEANDTFFVNLSNPSNAAILDGQGQGTITDDDAMPTLAVNDVTVTEGNAGTVNATFELTLSTQSGRDVVVNYATANASATAPADYQAATGSVTFAPGETTKQVTVTVNGDVLDEIDEAFLLNIASAPNASIADDQGQGTITDDDAMPALAVNDMTVTEGNSGTVNATFTVTLAPLSGRTVTVNYATANDSAVAPADYSATSGVLTFAAGETAKTVTVLVKGDLLDEVNETYFLNLTAPAGATFADSQGIGTILDDDATPSVSINDVSVTEGQSGTVNTNFAVSLSAASGQTVSVGYTTSDITATAGSDYVGSGGSVVFNPGETTKTLTIQVTGDVRDEPLEETFGVNLADPVHATIADALGVGTIVDDDLPPGISVSDVSVLEGDTGTVAATFTVSLNAPSGFPVTVDYATGDGTASAPADYAAATPSTLTFAPGETTRTVTVPVNGDLLDEANETFFLDLSNPDKANLLDNQGRATITDDDALPTISVNDVTVAEGDTGTVAATFTVTLLPVSGRNVTVNYATTNGSATAPGDYTALPTTALTFAPGETTKSVTVTVNGDALNELDEAFSLNLSNPLNATVTAGVGQGTITNDDPEPVLSLSGANVVEGNAGTVNANFTVTLSAASGRTVTVNYATAPGTATSGIDYQAASGTLTFASGQTTKTIAVVVNGDTANEAIETYFVNLSAPTNASIGDGQGIGTIIDDDGPPALSIDNQTVTEGQSGTVNANFTVTLAPAGGQTVTVNYSTSDGTATAPSDYAATSGTLTFLAGTTQRTITVPVKGDLVHELIETFTVTLSGAANASIDDNEGVGTILDTDPLPELRIDNPEAMAEGDSGAAPVTFTVSLSTPSGLPTSVQYATVDGTATAPADYAAANGTLNFAAGETTKTVTVLVNGDALNESTEKFFVDLASPSGATVADGRGDGTITDNDPEPAVAVNDVSVTEGDSGTVAATFMVTLAPASGREVKVNYVTANGTATAPGDYGAASGQLIFAPGQTAKPVTVIVNGDTAVEIDETFFINLTNAVNAAYGRAPGVATIANDDPAASPPPPPPPPAEPPPPPPPPAAPPPSQRKTTSALLSPLNGARLTAPPLLRWRALPRARFYNVQLYLAGRKILSFHPSKPQYKLHRQWTYQGRKYRLRKGAYTWLVWPAFGTKRRPQFGALLGESTFRMLK